MKGGSDEVSKKSCDEEKEAYKRTLQGLRRSAEKSKKVALSRTKRTCKHFIRAANPPPNQ